MEAVETRTSFLTGGMGVDDTEEEEEDSQLLVDAEAAAAVGRMALGSSMLFCLLTTATLQVVVADGTVGPLIFEKCCSLTLTPLLIAINADGGADQDDKCS